MNKNRFKKTIYINEITFFFGWIIIFFLGADKPPPIGFIWLVFLVVLLDVIQYFYLKMFLPKLESKFKGLFIKNLLFFTLGGLGVGVLTILWDIKLFQSIGLINTLIWILVIIIVSALYGVYFYIINAKLINRK